MKTPNRTGHIIGLILIFIMSAFIAWKYLLTTRRPYATIELLIGILFLISGYWRIYLFYKLQQIRKIKISKDFIDYMDNRSLVSWVLLGIVMAFPIPSFKKLESKEQNRLRITINILAIIYYIIGMTMLFWFN